MPLSGQIWPVHFPPFPDEALTSWFSRLALYHFQAPSTFFMYHMPYRSDSWKQDLDVVCSEDILRVFSRKCSQSSDMLRKHTLHYWRDQFDPYDGTSTALPRWITPAFIRRNTAHHHGCKICILCFRQRPYFKLNTRFLFNIACPIHGILLTEKCVQCNYPISSHRVFPPLFQIGQIDALAFCHHCGSDLRLDTPKSASQEEIEMVKFCLRSVTKGYCTVGGATLQFSHLFFEGFRLVCRGLLKPRQQELMNFCNSSFDPKPFYRLRQFEIEFLGIEDAQRILVAAMWLLKDWPVRFLAINRTFSLSYSDWIMPRDIVPYWFGSVAKEHLRKANITTRCRE